MQAGQIRVKGARENNLCNIHLELPRNQLICFTGVSGSGKSSLAFDTLYAEGQRRYIESLSTYARQFVDQLPQPDVDLIEGISPTICISQKTGGNNPRSTVGTITEIYDYLRLLYARVAKLYCPTCRVPVATQTRQKIVAFVSSLPRGLRLLVLAPIAREQKGQFRELFNNLHREGFLRARVDGRVFRLQQVPELDPRHRHNIEVVVDELEIGRSAASEITEAVELALKLGNETLVLVPSPDDHNSQQLFRQATKGQQQVELSTRFCCPRCQRSFPAPTPQLFSFNSPHGMCAMCSGLGKIESLDPDLLLSDPSLSLNEIGKEICQRLPLLYLRWTQQVRKIASRVAAVTGVPDSQILNTPWKDLDSQVRTLVLWGIPQEDGNIGPGEPFSGILSTVQDVVGNSRSAAARKLAEYLRTLTCPTCKGTRLNALARSAKLATKAAEFGPAFELSLPELCALPVNRVARFLEDLDLDPTAQVVAAEPVKEIRNRLQFLEEVGLGYLSLDRSAPTLAGGEMQRIRLAGQIGAGLVDVLYILDEPSIGLHPRDNHRLLRSLQKLRDQGNTVVVVEHDEDTIRAADYVVDFGPGPGIKGGRIVYAGPVENISTCKDSITGKYLAGELKIPIPQTRRSPGDKWLIVRGARHNNLKNIDVRIPLGLLVCVTGVSGSGKSSLVNDILAEVLRERLNAGKGHPGEHDSIEGLEHLDKMIAIDQSPIGRTGRSNPATYIKVFDEIRQLFARLPESRARGYKPGRFSFNVAGGRCEACEGNGIQRLEMDFLSDVWIKCPVCNGRRFNRETLAVRFKGKSIADVLEMDVQEALEHFANIPAVRRKLETLHAVGLDYIKLGQPSPTLSGGEAQRIKLARELSKKSTGKTIYLLDEPTTGLHFADVERLLDVLQKLVDQGNTVVIVEHNLEIIKAADWIIDLGPEGGEAGGRIVAEGPPEKIAETPDSHTGKALRAVLYADKKPPVPTKAKKRKSTAGNVRAIRVRGAKEHNLKEIDIEIPHHKLTVFCGPSGSGKSSLAMDTIYAEGQRRYVESLSTYARQFVAQLKKPQIEHIEGLSPAIAIEQKHSGQNPRSTVGTVTEIYDYLRLLMARLGTPYCPTCNVPIGSQTTDQIVGKLLALPAGTQIYLLAPVSPKPQQSYEALWQELQASGYVRVRIDGQTYRLEEAPQLDKRQRHTIEVVIDRLTIAEDGRRRLADSVEAALTLGHGLLRVAKVDPTKPEPDWPVETHSLQFACSKCGHSFEPLTPQHFSFNSPLGWCSACQGTGTQRGTDPEALLRDPKLSIAEGAIALFPEECRPLLRAILRALARQTGLPLDQPYEQLPTRFRTLLFHGTSEWIEVYDSDFADGDNSTGKPQRGSRPVLRFRFKGIYPTLEEASKISPTLRSRLQSFVGQVECVACGGSRLRPEATSVQLRGKTIDELCRMPLRMLRDWLWQLQLNETEKRIAAEVLSELRSRVQFLVDVGLEYLTLHRATPTLSGGEMQRIRLASQLGSKLCGVTYVLDEPTIGLHPFDNRRLLDALRKLRDLGNTLLVVEHDRDVISTADFLVDFGPKAGRWGGQIVAKGTPQEITASPNSVTGPYLSGKKPIPIPKNRRMGSLLQLYEKETRNKRRKQSTKSASANYYHELKQLALKHLRPPGGGWLEIIGARHNNLRNIDVYIPLGTLTVVTGVSGSGKSSLVDDILYAHSAYLLYNAIARPGACTEIRGLDHIDKVVRVDQQPIGQTPTSTPATYTGVFDLIRELFAQLPEATLRGMSPSHFSYNTPQGRCEKCQGAGQRRIQMHFLPDIWIECDECKGRRYKTEVLSVRYRGRSIADVLEMTCAEALHFFQDIPRIRRILQTLCDVGLDYLQLGQSATTLSGGEAQRVKLAAELGRQQTGKTLYLLDEPTTGLHFSDLEKLIEVLQRLVDLGNTVVVVEHNLDIIKSADWIVDLGPGGGTAGGWLVAIGTPEDVALHAERWCKNNPSSKKETKLAPPADPTQPMRSVTGEVLKPVLDAGPYYQRTAIDPHKYEQSQSEKLEIPELAEKLPMPWEQDGRRWHLEIAADSSLSSRFWDSRILEMVVDKIEQHEFFAPADWNRRSVVEIRASDPAFGWFFQAITSGEWLLTMRFRTARRTFRESELVEMLDLKPLSSIPDVPLYGRSPRVCCRDLPGPWQVVEMYVFRLSEVDREPFWQFLAKAIDGFIRACQRLKQQPQMLVPWKKLGQKWHLSHKGFPDGNQPKWPPSLLEKLLQQLQTLAPESRFDWEHQKHIVCRMPHQQRPWAIIHTKRPEAVYVTFLLPKGNLDAIDLTELDRCGQKTVLNTKHPRFDRIRLRIDRSDQLDSNEFQRTLRHCWDIITSSVPPWSL